MKKHLFTLLLLTACAPVIAEQGSTPQTSPSAQIAQASSSPTPTPKPTATPFVFPKAEVTIKAFKIRVEVATTPEETARGLMFRSSMPPEEGMIFVFEPPRNLSFWMKNTLIPLSIAYVDKDNKIMTIRHMEPESETLHPSGGIARYALEMNKGWFEKKGIKVGDSIELSDAQKWIERAKNQD